MRDSTNLASVEGGGALAVAAVRAAFAERLLTIGPPLHQRCIETHTRIDPAQIAEGFTTIAAARTLAGGAVVAQAGMVLILCERAGCAMSTTVAGSDQRAVDHIIGDLSTRIRQATASNGEVMVTAWHSYTPRLRSLSLPSWAEIARNYPGPSRATIESLMLPPADDSARLIVWYGPPGTGKTSAARALVREWTPYVVPHYVRDGDDFLRSEYRQENLLEQGESGDSRRFALVILEDIDRVLCHGREEAQRSLAGLLNLTDGFFAENLIFLVTTNAPIDRLDAALTRPGRCLGIAEFRAFTRLEASTWLGYQPPGDREEWTLAELFAMQRGDDLAQTDSPTRLGQYL